MSSGEIYGDAQWFFPTVDAPSQELAGFLQHIVVQLADAALFFQNRNKRTGRNQLPLMQPADKCLRSADGMIAKRHLRLIENHKFSRRKRGLEQGNDALALHHLLLHFLGKTYNRAGSLVPCCLIGNTADRHGIRRLLNLIQGAIAGSHPELKLRLLPPGNIGEMKISKCLKQKPQPRAVCDQDKIISAKSRNAVIRIQKTLYPVCILPENLVSFGIRQELIHIFEIVDIEHHNASALQSMLRKPFLHVFQKCFRRSNARIHIGLKRPKQKCLHLHAAEAVKDLPQEQEKSLLFLLGKPVFDPRKRPDRLNRLPAICNRNGQGAGLPELLRQIAFIQKDGSLLPFRPEPVPGSLYTGFHPSNRNVFRKNRDRLSAIARHLRRSVSPKVQVIEKSMNFLPWQCGHSVPFRYSFSVPSANAGFPYICRLNRFRYTVTISYISPVRKGLLPGFEK